MTMLILGLLLFLGVHSVSIVSRERRDALVAQHGLALWQGVYGVVSLVGLVLIVWGYGAAREAPIALWDPPIWTRHLSLLLMLPVFPLLFAAYLPGRIKDATKHPMLAAVKVWAFAHLIANGTLADDLLFGAFLAWAVVDRISVKRRPRQPAGQATRRPANDVIAVVGGVAVYAVFLVYAHEWLFGVAPIG